MGVLGVNLFKKESLDSKGIVSYILVSSTEKESSENFLRDLTILILITSRISLNGAFLSIMETIFPKELS